jgi:thiosulfate dehydrogenase
MRALKSHLFPICLGVIFSILMIISIWPKPKSKPKYIPVTYNENEEWQPPDETVIPFNEEGDKIRYGKELIIHTSFYLGPQGNIASLSNGMNCQNCHLKAGTQNFSNPFSAVAATYPKFRERSGRTESVEFRVNECMQRSLNGKPLDSVSKEMQAIVAYIKWVGSNVPKDVKPKGAGTEELHYLERAADTANGKKIYIVKCQRCHGANGEGVWAVHENEYTYPPLWGNNSFNVSAGIYRISRLAGFIKDNMPFGVTQKSPELTNEEAWDVAAFVASQSRSEKRFAYDWPVIATKPVDFPFGPFADPFSETQHKYGPFGPIKKKK